jgi:Tripartite tricarboxylate transporter family receptor
MTGQVLAFHRSGKLRVLAITSPARIIAAPEIPTAVEGGFPGMIAQQVIGLFAPTGTPKAIIEQIAQATFITGCSSKQRSSPSSIGPLRGFGVSSTKILIDGGRWSRQSA